MNVANNTKDLGTLPIPLYFGNHHARTDQGDQGIYCHKCKGIGNVSKSFVLVATFMSGQGTPGQSKVAKYTKNLATFLWLEERSCCQVQPYRLKLSYHLPPLLIIMVCILSNSVCALSFSDQRSILVALCWAYKDKNGSGGI